MLVNFLSVNREKNGIEGTQPDQKDCVSLKGDLAVTGIVAERQKEKL